MYTLGSLTHGIKNPRLVVQELNRLYHRRLQTWSYNHNGIDIFDRDWDTLLILDACRYDLFEQVSDLPGELESVISRGSATEEFIRGNFHGRQFHDTVYVTASPMLSRHRDTYDTEFHDVINVWQEDGWDEDFRTVLPGVVTRAALRAREQYPNKRLLVHYMQPHYPFVGPTGQEYFDLDRLDFQWEEFLGDSSEMSDEIIWDAYRENLELVLPDVMELFQSMQGKHVVTADHGNVIGSRSFPVPIREYGHPSGVYTESLVRVPWLTYQNGTRPAIESDRPVNRHGDDTAGELARERLQELGYVDS